jgi:predicted phosphodiesterase
MKIIVVSDIHLGYSHSEVNQFTNFLVNLAKRDDVKALVILGDFIDMWRRDASGLFLEFNDITSKIIALKEKIEVHIIAGNHDFHLLHLQDNYPFEFQKELILSGSDITYIFKHGWEFDPAQQEPIMELLCHTMSDKEGEVSSKFWESLKTIEKKILDSLEHVFTHHGGKEEYIKTLMTPPKDRLKQIMSDVEKRAYDIVGKNQMLIFGHTHRPFVCHERMLANSGSWVNDEETYNTYIEIDGKEIHLMQYGKGDVTSNFIRNFQI